MREQKHQTWCDDEECKAQFCSKHSLEYRDCDTGVKTHQGDRDVIGGVGNMIQLTYQCPMCRDAAHLERLAKQYA